jgi:membrane-associated phospholipid phosphatase
MNPATWRPTPSRPPAVATWLVPALAVLLLLVFADAGANRQLFLAVNGWAQALPAGLWADLTVLGDTLVAFCLALPLLRRRPDLVLALLLASLPAILLSHGLKALFAEPRPVLALGDLVHVIGDDIRNRSSFPSGHTTTVFVLAGVLAAGLRRQGLAWLAILVASLVGLSRIAVGAHWPADVAGGILCGWFSALLGHYLGRRLGWADNPRLLAVIRMLLVFAALHLLLSYDSDVSAARPFERSLALAVLFLHLLPGWRLDNPTKDHAPRP